MKQAKIPMLEMLKDFSQQRPLSFHVPGHKNGKVLPEEAREFYNDILKIDLTELSGLDDLHAPHGAIAEAERLASEFFQSDHTFFLVNGSTVGNLAMILAVCRQGDKVLVQRNCHKSVMHGLELAGAHPIFLAPEYDPSVQRFTSLSPQTLKAALKQHSGIKAIILTYPDYFGRIFDLREMIQLAHAENIPVLVDEAHGVHFAIGEPFPPSALALGADVVVHSAHKMAPAMTMASYLHTKSALISKESIAYRLQMLQSSSPSYPLMASLDIARSFLATRRKRDIEEVVNHATKVKSLFEASDKWDVLPADDPLKVAIQMKDGYAVKEASDLFEAQGIYPEMVTDKQILFVLGLAPFTEYERLKKVLKYVNETLKNDENHATIEVVNFFTEKAQELALSYQEMEELPQKLVPFSDSIGNIAAEPVIPYPPGIPLLLKGERVTQEHEQAMQQLIQQGVRIQQRNRGIRVFSSNLKEQEK